MKKSGFDFDEEPVFSFGKLILPSQYQYELNPIDFAESQLSDFSDTALEIAGILLKKDENGQRNCNTKAIRMLIDLADELSAFPELLKAVIQDLDINV